MRVTKFKFNGGDSDRFSINSSKSDWIELNDINLIVGKNASGKSTITRALNCISLIFLSGKGSISGDYEIQLINEKGDVFDYSIKKDYGGIISEEKLNINGKIKVDRNSDSTKLFSEEKNEFVTIHPPVGQTTIQVRRDEKEYPYFEELANWAKGIYLLLFSDANPNYLSFDIAFSLNSKEINEAIDWLLNGTNNENKGVVINYFNSIGYDIEEIDFRKYGDKNKLFVKEKGLKYEFEQFSLSNGMFRSLLLIIHLYYLIEKQKATLIIIDDLCEGLDYERATELGKVIFEMVKGKNVQFVATSNDFFLMNTVDIENWNIIKRASGNIKSYNFENSKEKFTEFKFTGLNNFQLFASDYLNVS